MRFLRLTVDNFQAIEHAAVSFGTGLNVLFGPNDLGKSTLATALRAALLLPATSAEAEGYVPWTAAGQVPRVELVLETEGGLQHRVVKSFGSARGTATLERSRSGADWELVARAREVDEKLRALLSWGVPAPGGRGGPRGLPEPFLAHALVPSQADVDHILRASLEQDPDDSGKVRLTRALQAFAQDPRFKLVQEEAQRQVDRLFTPGGQRRRGKGSPFLAAAEEVKGLQAEVDRLARDRELSARAEAQVRRLSGELVAAREAEAAAIAARTQVEAEVQRTRRRRELELRVAEVEAELASFDAAERALAQLEVAAREGALELARLEAAERTAGEEVEAARAALERAREEASRAGERQVEAERALRRAGLVEERAAVESELSRVRERLSRAAGALAVDEEAARVEAELRALAQNADGTRKRRDAAGAALAKEEEGKAQLDALRTYARLQDARAARERASLAAQAADAAAQRSTEARARARALRAEVEHLVLPSSEAADELVELERSLQLAEAALGGGLTLRVRSLEGVALSAGLDGRPASLVPRGAAVEAERAMELSIPGVLELEITAGQAEPRRNRDRLRARFDDEAGPVLALAGAGSITELRELCRGAAAKLRAADEEERRATALDDEVVRARPREELLRDLADREARLAPRLEGKDPEQLARLFTTLGAGWEEKLDRTEAAFAQKIQAARAAVSRAEGEVAKLSGEEAQLSARAADARSAREREHEALGGPPAVIVERERAAEAELLRRADAVAGALAALEEEGRVLREGSRARELEAAETLAATEEAHRAAGQRVTDVRSRIDRARGELVAEDRRVRALPRAAKEAERSALRADLAELPASSALAQDEQLEEATRRVRAAEQRVRERNDELRTAEGALEHVGGAVLEERSIEVERALERAKERQRELEIDAEAWKLVLEALAESESTGVRHPGRVLAQEVSRRFSSLAGPRYGALELTPELETQGIESAGALRGVGALSVGTREQLATLLRLAIAQSLKSAIVLDDHLVQSDPTRLQFFLAALQDAAREIQVVVVTCRPKDYEPPGRKKAAAAIQWVNLEEHLRRFAPVSPGAGVQEGKYAR